MAGSSVRVLLALNRVCARGSSEKVPLRGGTHGREYYEKEGAMETEWRDCAVEPTWLFSGQVNMNRRPT